MTKLNPGPYSRILLVKPLGSSGLAFALPPIPFGLECIAGYIRNKVDDVIIFDEYLDKEPFSEFLRVFKPEIVGFSLSATEHNTGGKLMKKVRKYDPSIPIIAGGFHPTGAPEIVLNELDCDLISRGEGEITITELIQGKPWEEINGLSYFNNSTRTSITHNPDRELIKDLDSLPFPARDLRARQGYHYTSAVYLDREWDQMEFSRGCYGLCTWCCEPYMSNGRMRFKSPERMMEEMYSVWELHKEKPMKILIGDPHIMGNPKKIERLAELLIEADLDITFQVMCRVETIVKHPKIVEKMVRAGMISFELGIESSSQNDLDLSNKRQDISLQKKAVNVLKKYGIISLGTYVVGLPSATRESIKTYPDHAYEIGLSATAYAPATPFPGTPFWDILSKPTPEYPNGKIFEKDWANFDTNQCTFYHPTLTSEEIGKLRDWNWARFWGVHTFVEQIRLKQIRVGKFRSIYKATLFDLVKHILSGFSFLLIAGDQLLERVLYRGNLKSLTKAERNKKIKKAEEEELEKNMDIARRLCDGWAQPLVEKYFQQYPMHTIVDMRQFGKLFGNRCFQLIFEDGEAKKCLIALHVSIVKDGIDILKMSKHALPKCDLNIRFDLREIFSSLKPTQLAQTSLDQLKSFFMLLTGGAIKIKGWRMFLKLALFIIKEVISAKVNPKKA